MSRPSTQISHRRGSAGSGSLCMAMGGLTSHFGRAFSVADHLSPPKQRAPSTLLTYHWPAVPNLGDLAFGRLASRAAGRTSSRQVLLPEHRRRRRPEGHYRCRRSRVSTHVAHVFAYFDPPRRAGKHRRIRSRGLGTVIADLAAIGYDAEWTCLRASNAGAPHRRDRWFCVAYPAVQDTDRATWQQRWPATTRQTQGGRARPDAGGRGGVPPTASRLALLPTPAARDWRSGASNLLDVNSRPLNEFVVNRLTAPAQNWIASDGTDYGPAVRHWEAITGHPAPCPTEPGTRGNRRLSPQFAEWMMGLPPSHVTGVPGLARNAQIRIIGGGVVPRQGTAALDHLLTATATEAAA